jgi:hypothetical protein
MKKRFIVSIFMAILMLFSYNVNASVIVNVNDVESGFVNKINFTGPSSLTRIGDELTVPAVDASLIAAGAANGGATSMTTATLAVPVGYSYINVSLNTADPAFTSKTIADGKIGQLMTIHVHQGANATTFTPETSYGFSSFSMNAVDDQITLLFLETQGWVVVSSTSVTLTP